MTNKLTLVSHNLCPYVQRAVIVLLEKRIPFKRIDIGLGNKPEWFLQISPMGKTPVLLVDSQAIFESAVICEYLDETISPLLHPQDALERARHRGWMEFGSVILNAIGAFYNAPDENVLTAKVADIASKFEQIEAQLSHGPYFAGERFGMVDAAFGPVFRYFDVFEEFEEFGFFRNVPRVRSWRSALAQRDSIRRAASTRYSKLLLAFLLARRSAISAHIETAFAPPEHVL